MRPDRGRRLDPLDPADFGVTISLRLARALREHVAGAEGEALQEQRSKGLTSTGPISPKQLAIA